MGVSCLCLSRRQDFPVLDTGRIVTVGGRIGRDGISRLLSPSDEQIAGLLDGLRMLGVLRQIGKLMRIVANHKEFLRRARIGEDLALLGVGLARGMSLPKLGSGRVVVVRLVTEIGLVREVVADIKIITKADHPLMVPVDMPVMLREDDFTHLSLGILENGQKASPLNEGGPLDPGEFEAGGA